MEELNTSGSYRDIGQAFAVLLTVKRGSGSWETAGDVISSKHMC